MDTPVIDVSALFGLRVRTARLELRLPSEDEMVALAVLADRGVHPPDRMPFRHPWTDRTGQELVDGTVAYHRGARDEWRVERWALPLAVFTNGETIGCIEMRGDGFQAGRSFETGSWLGGEHQGRGYGTEMRVAVLALGFDGLGALVAFSGAFDWNTASLRVSEKLGYRPTGETNEHAPRGTTEREIVMELEREEWERRVHPPVEIDGLERCLHLFGL